MKGSTLTKLIISMLLIIISVFGFIFFQSVAAMRFNKQNALLGTQNFRILGNILGPDQKPFNRPLAVAVSDKNVYIADSGNRRVVQYSADGKFIRSFGDTGNSSSRLLFPTDLAVGLNNRIYVADRMSGRVMIYKSDGEIVKAFPLGTDRVKLKGFSPLSLAIDQDNNVFVFDAEHQRLVLFDEDGRLLKVLLNSSKQSEFSFVNGIAISEPDKKIYISNSNQNNILVSSKDGSYLQDLAGFFGVSDFFLPRGIALDNSSNKLLIAASFQHKILYYDLKTNKIMDAIGIVQKEEQVFKYPNDIAISEDKGLIYVADTGQNRIVVLEYVTQ